MELHEINYPKNRKRLQKALAKFKKYISNDVPDLKLFNVINETNRNLLRDGLSELKSDSGVYALFNHDGNLEYIGSALTNRGLDSRSRSNWSIGLDEVGFIDIIPCPEKFGFLMLALQSYLITVLPGIRNKRGGFPIPDELIY